MPQAKYNSLKFPSRETKAQGLSNFLR